MKNLRKHAIRWLAACCLCNTLNANAQSIIRDYDLYTQTTHLGNALETTPYGLNGHLWGGWRAYHPKAEEEYIANGGNLVQTGVPSAWVMRTDMQGAFSGFGTNTFSNIYLFQDGGSNISVTSARVCMLYNSYAYACVYSVGVDRLGLLFMNIDIPGNMLFQQGYKFNAGVTAAEITSIQESSYSTVDIIGKVYYGNAVKIFAAKVDGFGRLIWSNEYDFNPVAPLTEANENPKTLFYDWVNHTMVIGGDAQFVPNNLEDAFMLVLNENNGSVVQTLRFPMPGLYGGQDGSTLNDIEISTNSVTGISDYVATGFVRDVHIMPWVLRVQREPVPSNITGSWVYDLPVNTGNHPYYWYAEGTNIDQATPTNDRNNWTYRMAGELYINSLLGSRCNFLMNIDNSGNASEMYLYMKDPIAYRKTKGLGTTLVPTNYPSVNSSAVFSAHDDGTIFYPTLISNIMPPTCWADSEAVQSNPLMPGITLFGVTTKPALVTNLMKYVSMYSDTSNYACVNDGNKHGTTSITQIDNNSAVKVYPNPTSASITIDAAGTDASVDILNIQGIKIGTATLSAEGSYHFDASGLPSGLYLVRVNNGDKQQVLQFTKL